MLVGALMQSGSQQRSRKREPEIFCRGYCEARDHRKPCLCHSIRRSSRDGGSGHTENCLWNGEQVSPTKKNLTKMATATMNAMYDRVRRYRAGHADTHPSSPKADRNHPLQDSWCEETAHETKTTSQTDHEKHAGKYAVGKPKNGYVEQLQKTESNKQ